MAEQRLRPCPAAPYRIAVRGVAAQVSRSRVCCAVSSRAIQLVRVLVLQFGSARSWQRSGDGLRVGQSFGVGGEEPKHFRRGGLQSGGRHSAPGGTRLRRWCSPGGCSRPRPAGCGAAGHVIEDVARRDDRAHCGRPPPGRPNGAGAPHRPAGGAGSAPNRRCPVRCCRAAGRAGRRWHRRVGQGSRPGSRRDSRQDSRQGSG